MKESTWVENFHVTVAPSYPCPTCEHGRLLIQRDSLKRMEPNWSKARHDDEFHDHDHDTERFVVFYKCDNGDCGEVSAVSGDIDAVDAEMADGRDYVARVLCPKSMFPAPHIIEVPEKTPESVKAELVTSFQLYWADPASCASRVRTSLERLMDHFGVPKTRLDSKTRKRKRIDLFIRIEKFCAAAKNVVHQESLHALREVGNLATHEGKIERKKILTAYRVYEEVLQELIGRRSAEIKKLARDLRAK
jgi:hypothetical protein